MQPRLPGSRSLSPGAIIMEYLSGTKTNHDNEGANN